MDSKVFVQTIQQASPVLGVLLGLGMGAIATYFIKNFGHGHLRKQQTDEHWLQSVYEHVELGMNLTDPKGRYIRVNQAYCQILGYSAAELLNGMCWQEITYPADVVLDQSLVHHDYQGRMPAFAMEKRCIRKDGNIVWIKVHSSQIHNPQGELKYIASIIEDITDRKQTEQRLQNQAALDRMLNKITQAIHNSLDAETIFSTVVLECARLLNITQVFLVKYHPEQQVWRPKAFYSHPPIADQIQQLDIADANNPIAAQLKRGEMVRIDRAEELEDEVNQPLAALLPGSWLILPIWLEELWGALTLIQPEASWQDTEVELAKATVNQLATAIQHSELYQQVQQLNTHLEQQVEERTAEIQTALRYEALLKRITDKVRDSLDEDQILQAAVDELGKGLDVFCCSAAIYSTDGQSHKITHEYSTQSAFGLGMELLFEDCSSPEIFTQLMAGQAFQFCYQIENYALSYQDQYFAIFACPLQDDQGVLGDLWLFNPVEKSYKDLDIRIVQQVANQCAIALRQSSLYQAAQAQVRELERLNQLKDDFLSTVSHELRTPMSNIKMATQMLEIHLEQMIRQMGLDTLEEAPTDRYLQILQDECQREISLINDLLDLSRLDSGSEPILLRSLHLQHWLPYIAESLSERIRNQQQQLVFEIPSDLPGLTTDFTDLERIMLELLYNACKYTPPQETIKVTVTPFTATATGGEPAIGDGLQIAIANSGVEIPAEELVHVFDKFYRVPNNDPWKHGGTGLGLALVKKRLERLQGTIDVTSANQWTTFTIHLPLHPHPKSD